MAGLGEQMPGAVVLAGEGRVRDPLDAADAHDLAKERHERRALPSVHPVGVEQQPGRRKAREPFDHRMQHSPRPRRIGNKHGRGGPFYVKRIRPRDPIRLRLNVASKKTVVASIGKRLNQRPIARARLNVAAMLRQVRQQGPNSFNWRRVEVTRDALKGGTLTHAPDRCAQRQDNEDWPGPKGESRLPEGSPKP